MIRLQKPPLGAAFYIRLLDKSANLRYNTSIDSSTKRHPNGGFLCLAFQAPKIINSIFGGNQ